MGFEQDYRQGLHDKNWGRASRAFVNNAPDHTVSRVAKAALCKVFRDMARSGATGSLLKVIDEHATAQRQAQAMSRESLLPFRERRQEIIDDFMVACAPIVRDEENSHIIRRLVTLGVGVLEDALDTTVSVPPDLLVEFIRDFIEANMQPALEIAGEKCHDSPDAVQARFGRVLTGIPIAKIADDLRNGKAAHLRVPMSRTTVEQFARKSLLVKDQS